MKKEELEKYLGKRIVVELDDCKLIGYGKLKKDKNKKRYYFLESLFFRTDFFVQHR